MIELTAGALCDAVENVSGVTAADEALKNVNAGYARFLAGLDERDGSLHVWTFLQEFSTLALSYQATGTATGVYDGSTYTVVTATADVFSPTNIGDDMVVADTGTYEVDKYVSPSVVWILGDHAFAGKGITFPHSGIYDLPSDYVGMVSKPFYSFSTDESRRELIESSPDDILREWRGLNAVSTADKFAVVPKTFTAATGQRWQIMFSPRFQEDRFVRYIYQKRGAALTDDAAVYPVGGAAHSHTIRAAALSDYEKHQGDVGVYEQEFQKLMAASIDHDTQIAKTYGASRVGNDGPEIG